MVDFTSFMQNFSQQAGKVTGFGGTAQQYGQPQVYWGQKPTGYEPGTDSLQRGRKPSGVNVDNTRSVDESAIAFYSEWSDEERQAWAKRMYNNGFIRDPNDMEGAFQAWSQAVKRASDVYTFSGKKVTPWDAMSLMEGASGAGGRNGPKTTTSKSTSYNIPTKEDVAGMVTSVFKGALGRAPSDGELSRYTSMLIGNAKKNPSITTTTQTTDVNGNTTSKSTSSGGYSSQAAEWDAMQRAQADPEYGAYQAATTYFNALVSALGAPG
jgi:hypothetical protein